eukprot:TRINITY_DN69193_c0_g1_i1.p1 TRINITY_DN69193_c0_g1~~TRINITY_DN69193_c0_g1_i1.p1  ORF type:complete len:129 (-),score=6.83 TRINITY_DN69193_c0_g1_i1:45-431(-)
MGFGTSTRLGETVGDLIWERLFLQSAWAVYHSSLTSPRVLDRCFADLLRSITIDHLDGHDDRMTWAPSFGDGVLLKELTCMWCLRTAGADHPILHAPPTACVCATFWTPSRSLHHHTNWMVVMGLHEG